MKMAITGGSIIFRDTHVIEILLMICLIAKLSETGNMFFKHGGPGNIQRAPCDCSCCMGQNFGNPISSPVEVHSEDTAKNVRHILKQNLRQGPSLHEFQEVMVGLVQLVKVILGAYSGLWRPNICSSSHVGHSQKEYSLPQHATTIYCCCGFPLPISLVLIQIQRAAQVVAEPSLTKENNAAYLNSGKLNKLWSKEGSRNPAYLDLEILLGGEVFHISQPLSALHSLRLTWRCRTQPGTWLLVPSPPSRPKGSLPATHTVSTESTRNVAMSQTEISQELANKLIPMPNC